MKRGYFISVLLLISGYIFAQPTFNFGVKAGINSSKITESSIEFSSEPIIKMHVGAYARYGGFMFIQPEAYFSAKGSKMPSRDGTDTKFNLNDVDIPVLLGIRLINKKNIKLRLLTGPVFCSIVSKSIDYEVRLYSPFGIENFKDSYMGYQYGASVEFGKLSLDARMENGIDKVYEPSGASYRTSGFLNSKDNTFMLTFGYRFL
ncbi:MAG: porin family protein [Prolixibacteraceae bacterium]|jgi:hypothetical protein